MTTTAQSIVSDIRLIDIVYAIRRRFRFVLTMAAAIFVLLSIFVFTEAPVYRAYVTLAPAPPLVDPNPTLAIDGLLGTTGVGNIGVFQAQTSANSALALLRSKAISRRYIETNNLLPILFADEWDSEDQVWRESDSDDQPTLNEALELFEREVRFISKNDATGFVRVNIEWSDPELAAKWANGLVEMTDRLIRERDIAEASRSIQFLEDRARNAPLESVKQLIYELIESNAKKIMVANVKDSYVYTVIDPAIAPQADDTINMPASLKLALVLIFALGCSMLWAIIATELEDTRS